MTFCIWGRYVELLIDAATLALNNQVKIFTRTFFATSVLGIRERSRSPRLLRVRSE